VLLAHHGAAVVERTEDVASFVGHEEGSFDGPGVECPAGGPAEVVESRARPGRHDHRAGVELGEPPDGLGIGGVDLVEHEELRIVGGADLGQHRANRLDLRVGIRVGGIDDVEQEIGVGDLLERRMEGLDELMREPAHEPDGVGDERRVAVVEIETADGRIERGEQPVLDEDACARQPVEERRLAGVRVADDRGGRAPRRAAGTTARRATPGGIGEQPFDLAHPLEDAAAVGLQLRLSGPPGPDAGAEAAHLRSSTAKAGKAVPVLGELDLQHALLRVGMLGEDVEDQRDAVDDVATERPLEVPLLRRGEVVVEDDDVDVEHLRLPDELPELSRAQERGGVEAVPADEERGDRLRPGGVGEGGELDEAAIPVA